jgi:hypothetical protein
VYPLRFLKQVSKYKFQKSFPPLISNYFLTHERTTSFFRFFESLCSPINQHGKGRRFFSVSSVFEMPMILRRDWCRPYSAVPKLCPFTYRIYIRVISFIFYSINGALCALKVTHLGYTIEVLFPTVGMFFNIVSRPAIRPT